MSTSPSLALRVYSHAIEERNRAAATIMGQVLGAPKEPEAEPVLRVEEEVAFHGEAWLGEVGGRWDAAR